MLQPNNLVAFIDTDYFKLITGVDHQVDDELLIGPIQLAMDIRIQQVLGNALYVKLKQGNIDNSLSSEYEILLNDYIRPATAYWALYYVLPALNFRLTNKAVTQKRSDNSDSVDMQVINQLRRDAQNNAEAYTQFIRDAIHNNQSTFKEYYTYPVDEGMKPNSSFTGGIYIDKRYRNRCR